MKQKVWRQRRLLGSTQTHHSGVARRMFRLVVAVSLAHDYLLLGQHPHEPHSSSPSFGTNLFLLPQVQAWEWSDWGMAGSGGTSMNVEDTAGNTPLSIQEVSELRVRDLKRRLARSHGYSAEELDRILDKKELIHALAFEEEKVRLQQQEQAKRQLAWRGVVATVLAVLVVMCWPLLHHAWEVAHVNWVVYTDRKRHEASRCLELKSWKGVAGVLLMGLLDLMQLWLTTSILMSWITTPKWWFFPVPRLSVRPAAFMGGSMAQSSLANYGINIGSMAVTWGMRFIYGKIELWTGKALASAHRQQRRDERAWESVEDRAARRAARKQAKVEMQQQRQQQQYQQQPRPPPAGMEPVVTSSNQPHAMAPQSRAHENFIAELGKLQTAENEDESIGDNEEISASIMDELD